MCSCQHRQNCKLSCVLTFMIHFILPWLRSGFCLAFRMMMAYIPHTGCAQLVGRPSRYDCLCGTGHPWPPARLVWALSLLALLAGHAVCHPVSKDGRCCWLVPLSAPASEKLLPACAPAWPGVLHSSTQQWAGRTVGRAHAVAQSHQCLLLPQQQHAHRGSCQAASNSKA